MATSRFAHLVGSKQKQAPALKDWDRQGSAIAVRQVPVAQAQEPSPPSAADQPADSYTRAPGGLRRPAGSQPTVLSGGGNPFRGQASFDLKIKYSEEQDAIIQSPAKLIVARAFAGTGKTTTAVGFAARRPGSRVLYMPFGKSVQLEAVKRFPTNTICQTINSAAYSATSNLRPKLVQSWPALTIRNEMNLSTNRQAGLVHNILNQYMVSADADIRPIHGSNAMERWRATDSEISDAIAVARLAWRRMKDPSDKMPISHDALLKIWSMSSPKLDYDVIIFDEAQDTNPVTQAIIKQQTHATRLYIGDSHQSIYKFRGAENAMDEMAADPSATLFNLSQTWRFGPKIAEIANTILGELKGESVKIVGMGLDSSWEKGAQIAKISRTNAQLFREAASRNGVGVHWVGRNGILDYGVDRILQAHAMYKGEMAGVTDPILRSFRSWAEAQAYAEDAQDQEVRVLVSIIEEFRDETPALVADLKLNEVKDASAAEIILTTAHKAKGLDWDYVQICDDFEFLEDLEEKLAQDPYAPINDQEVNLLYVAATRAKKAIQLNKETNTWLEKLDEHRSSRMLAKARVDERRSASRALMSRSAA